MATVLFGALLFVPRPVRDQNAIVQTMRMEQSAIAGT
jgi:hypothetical protein